MEILKLYIYLIIFIIIGWRDGNLETLYLPDNLYNNWLEDGNHEIIYLPDNLYNNWLEGWKS